MKAEDKVRGILRIKKRTGKASGPLFYPSDSVVIQPVSFIRLFFRRQQTVFTVLPAVDHIDYVGIIVEENKEIVPQ